ncbi:DEAD/DEAH box helicase family protein [Bradyrhizobium sp. AUGA SZCCT0240]|uniref:DEAD/DEAH box helicase n=1 Tax=Bradyrhizobium sp. AUGA SZCCT0240 TaxID=2807669 RepID=UPI001BA993B9|nr:DEAD/DEAH box helicase [Bradyrhizobium sp. AUGA SZCCT0240]MBR1252278.1 DEAD/DEAH box helicase family protein [Bradyrhizobium sp. AUGA SZCCT0240]
MDQHLPHTESALVEYSRRLCEDRLAAYRNAPHDTEEHANIETSVIAGGYAYRQVAELVQNAADAVSEMGPEQDFGRIEVRADALGLWAANTGLSVDKAGVRALLNAHSSGKRAGQIGRFGLGFKSLLRLGGRIDVLSRSVCLRFDPRKCRDRIRRHVGLAADAPSPGLRLADASAWDHTTAMIEGADAFNWATTIVFAELVAPGAREAIADEISRFPAEFLLFLPCDVELVLEAGQIKRRLRRRTAGDGSIVIEDQASERSTPQRWKLFHTDVHITDEAALHDATSVHSRDLVPLVWAAPVGTQREVGRFFAFFPTSTETRTSGILNAPWKLNSDRTALIPGPWNSALMEAAADLIVAHLGELVTDEDPGAALDAFPRELPTTTDTAAPLVTSLWNRLIDEPVLPNCDNELKKAAELRRAPLDTPNVIQNWAALASPQACEIHVHPSCTSSPARSARLNQLADRLARTPSATGHRLQRTEQVAWLTMTASSDPETAIEVLALLDLFAKAVSGWIWDSIRERLPLILTETGSLTTAPNVVLNPDTEPPLHPVHPQVASHTASRRILQDRFHVSEAAEADWQRLMDGYLSRAERENDWSDVWKLLRRMPRSDAADVLKTRSVRVRTLGGWNAPEHVVRYDPLFLDELSGDLREPARTELGRIILDTQFHRTDEAFLKSVDLELPQKLRWSSFDAEDYDETAAGKWYEGWLRKWRARYHQKLGSRPDIYLLRPDAFDMPVGWQLFLFLEGEARAKLTMWLLAQLQQEDFVTFDAVAFRHSSRPHAWDAQTYPHPFWSLLLERGIVANDGGVLPFQQLLCMKGDKRAVCIPSLVRLSRALDQIKRAGLGWHSGLNNEQSWPAWLNFAAYERENPLALLPFYAFAAKDGFVPRLIAFPDGPVPIEKVRLARSPRDAKLAMDAGFNSISADSAMSALWIKAGALDLDLDGGLSYEPCEDRVPERLVDVEPSFTDVIDSSVTSDAYVLFVDNLCQTIGGVKHRIGWTVQDNRILICTEDFARSPWVDRLRMLTEGATALGWIRDSAAMDRMRLSGPAARRRRVASRPDLPARLLAATGGTGPILELFDPDVAAELKGSPVELARLAVTLFGPALLARSTIRDAMNAEGLDPPQRWGSEAAAEFVAALGFPPEFATPPDRRREPELSVPGPFPLKPLHDFQEDVAASLDGIFADSTAMRRRCVVSLPTGAGKTRVVAEVAVTRILAPTSPNRLVLWIAQSDELCEQAVQCFRELWPNRGSQGDALRLIRFWGGQANPNPSRPGQPTVIVASIQTLNSRTVDSSLAWAGDPGLLVIDECHHALTPSYTGALRWLNADRTDGTQEPPIVGLSATPFRGLNQEESRQLARRFDERLVPKEQTTLFEQLQAQGVLARFTYTRLDITDRFELTPDEIRSMETFHRLPESAMERLGNNRKRNDRILSAVASAPEQSILVFATSVAHANRLAARLNLLGIQAAAVSGETDRSSRRWFIDRFRRGGVRVLCNHSALTTGFDAPATDLIVIARPVFSPSLYMQMVGRGLRGPANGGKQQCRILTIQDNLDQFTGMLAHRYFEQHYVS